MKRRLILLIGCCLGLVACIYQETGEDVVISEASLEQVKADLFELNITVDPLFPLVHRNLNCGGEAIYVDTTARVFIRPSGEQVWDEMEGAEVVASTMILATVPRNFSDQFIPGTQYDLKVISPQNGSGELKNAFVIPDNSSCSDTSDDSPCADTDTNTDTNTDTDTDTDTDTGNDTESDTDIDTDTDTETETETDTNTDADTDADTDTETDTDTDTDTDTELGEFSRPTQIAALSDPDIQENNPSFTADRLELYFNSDGFNPSSPDNSDIWVSKRTSTSEPWGTPELVAEVFDTAKESTPRIAPDGLTLWFSSDRASVDKKLDIWVTTRATRTAQWTTPVSVDELNSAEADSGAGATFTMFTLVFTSERFGSQGADLYWSTRTALTDPWGTPSRIPGVNTADDEGAGQIISGGLEIFFASSGHSASSDLFYATRASTSEDFGDITPLTVLNTTWRETSPWLSEDGRYIVFSSNSLGNVDIFEATR